MFFRIGKGFSFFQIIILVLCGYVSALENVTTVTLVEEAGYPVEEHEVTTDDGYILIAHRIPYSPTNETQVKSRPVAILQHGFEACSSDWIVLGPGKGLAYLLSDRGFDVWLLNSRGNTYSSRNNHILPILPAFWNFSFHEMGIYDLPAWFHYIRNVTGVQKFHYFAHSQGTTDYLVLCSLLPEYNDWIKSAHLLAPIAFTVNMNSVLVKIFGPFISNIYGILTIFPFQLGSANEQFHDFATTFCNDHSIVQSACVNLLFEVVGDSVFFNTSLIPLLTLIYPAGSSDKQAIHYIQISESGKFRQYDYGLLNLKYYNASEPPEYNLDNVAAPTYIYYSQSDSFAVELDVLRLAVTLPKTSVKRIYRVKPKYFNHIDFLVGTGVEEIVYAQVLKDLSENL